MKLEVGRSFELDLTLCTMFLKIGKWELWTVWHPSDLQFVLDKEPPRKAPTL